MKKKLLCLLLALAVVMSVVPLTALAESEETVPEKYWGNYKGTAWVDSRKCDAYIDISEDQAYLCIPDSKFDTSLSFIESVNSETLKFKDSGCVDTLSIDFGKPTITAQYTSYGFFSQYKTDINNIEKVSDSTDSTLSTGSNLIIPIAAAVLLIGGVIFIGKRKKEITE